MGAAKLVQDNEHDSKSSSHSREEECNCGQVVSWEDNKKHRMVTTANGGKPNIPSMGSTSHRSICHGQEQETSNILFSSTTSKCGSSRCILSLLGRDASICIPSSNSPEQSSEENLGGELHSNFDSTKLAKTAMVSDVTKAISSNSNEATRKRRSTDSRSGSNSTSRPQCIKPSSLEIVKTRKVKKGFSSRVASIMATARRPSTTGTYDARLRKYYSWCRERNVNPTTASIIQIASFLQELFDKEKFSTSTIAGYRAAISVVHKGFKGTPLGQVQDLKQLIIGMPQLRPPKKVLAPNWSLPLVLNMLIKEPFEPMDKVDIKYVTLKTAFLLAVASGRRVSEIHALSTDKHHLRWEGNHRGVRLRTNQRFLAKNESLRNPGKDIFLSSFGDFTTIPEERLMCPCRALRIYLKRTKTVHESVSQLFVTFKKGAVKGASKASIARWIVQTVRLSYEKANRSDLDLVKAHDTRALSTSWALFQGVRIEEIMRAAFWAADTTFTSFYLRDVAWDDDIFSRSLLETARRSGRQ